MNLYRPREDRRTDRQAAATRDKGQVSLVVVVGVVKDGQTRLSRHFRQIRRGVMSDSINTDALPTLLALELRHYKRKGNISV